MDAKAETLLVMVAYLYIVDSRLFLDRDHSASSEQADMLTSPNRYGIRDGHGVRVGPGRSRSCRNTALHKTCMFQHVYWGRMKPSSPASAGRIWAYITPMPLEGLCICITSLGCHSSGCSTMLGNNAWDCLFSQEGFCARSMLGMNHALFECADFVHTGNILHQVYRL